MDVWIWQYEQTRTVGFSFPQLPVCIKRRAGHRTAYFLRVGLSLLTGSVLFMAGMLVKSETGAFIVMMLPMICEYAAYHFIVVTGTLRVCKIINPFSIGI